MSNLSCIEINPATSPIGTVIWLHGLGADGNDFVPIVPELNLPQHIPLRFVFPNAPTRAVTINNGYVMRAWYDIVSFDINGHADEQGILASVQQLNQLIEQEHNKGMPYEKILLAGFSQGAAIALTTGLCYSKRLAGIIALSGYLALGEKTFQSANHVNHSIPIFLGHGTEDTIVPLILGQATADLLTKQGYKIEWHSYPMPHSVCMDEIQDIGRLLVKVFA